MTVRNWWFTAHIDGRKTATRGGPQSKDGGFDLTIRQRDGGSSVVAAKISGSVDGRGVLRLAVYVRDGDGSLPLVGSFCTDR